MPCCLVSFVSFALSTSSHFLRCTVLNDTLAARSLCAGAVVLRLLRVFTLGAISRDMPILAAVVALGPFRLFSTGLWAISRNMSKSMASVTLRTLHPKRPLIPRKSTNKTHTQAANSPVQHWDIASKYGPSHHLQSNNHVSANPHQQFHKTFNVRVTYSCST